VSDKPPIPDRLRASAYLVVDTIRENLGVTLTFDRAGVEWVDGYINRLRHSMAPNRRSGLIGMLASFVGECIIQTYGGAWAEEDGRWGVRVSERLWACPSAKIEKQFDNGPEDSVSSFFTCIPTLDKHLADNPA
jgi:hypothetical protein